MTTLLSKLREKRVKGDDGFTLIELLVVVVILGVLIAIAIPLYLNYRKGANDAAAQSDLRNAISVLEVCNTEKGVYPITTQTFGSPANVPVGCTTQTINLSSGTSLTYTVPTTAPGASYVIYASSTSGTAGKFFCYDSKVGGSVATQTAIPKAAAASCSVN